MTVVVLTGGVDPPAGGVPTLPSGPPVTLVHPVGLEIPISLRSLALGLLWLSALSLPLGRAASVVGGLLLSPPPNLGLDPPLALPLLPSA